MNEIYWITRLDAICCILICISVSSSFVLIVSFYLALCSRNDAETYKEYSGCWDKYMREYKKWMRNAKRCAVIFFVSVFINIFIPTTNQALLIYGVGGTVDYIKSNDTAKQLPDKCVKALDKYLDNLTKEENQKENDNESK